jgi:hypothetical protein
MLHQELLALRLKLRRSYAGLPRRQVCLGAHRPAIEAEASQEDDDGVGVKRSPKRVTDIDLIKKLLLDVLKLPEAQRDV